MPTYVFSKKDFITWIEKEVSEDEAFVFTNELCGSLTISKKNGLRINHVFAHDVFKDEGVGHIVMKKSFPFGLIIAKKERLSDVGCKALNKDLNVQASVATGDDSSNSAK